MDVRCREGPEEVEEEDGVCRKYATDCSNPIEETYTPPPLPFQLQPLHTHKHAYLPNAIAYHHEIISPNYEGSYEYVYSVYVCGAASGDEDSCLVLCLLMLLPGLVLLPC